MLDFYLFVCLAGLNAGFQFLRSTGIERHSSARPFLIHDYGMNRGTRSSDRGIVSNLGDPLDKKYNEACRRRPFLLLVGKYNMEWKGGLQI